MPEITYIERNFSQGSLDLIVKARAICESYAAQQYSLTLRQLYYQFVARGWLPNKDTEYKRLGSVVNDARLAGLLDWDHVVDRTRKVEVPPRWDSPEELMGIVAKQFRIDKWEGQPVRMEVWVEKEALIDVIRRPALIEQLPYFACRGYNSQSNAWAAAQRISEYFDAGAERVVVLHLGDHDPSGIDMTRDIGARFRTFLEGDGYDPDALEIRRIALNIDQVRRYNPPPNPAKMTDSRVGDYVRRFGSQSWELDALDPPTIDALIRAEVGTERDPDLWDEAVERENVHRTLLGQASARWSDVVSLLEAATR